MIGQSIRRLIPADRQREEDVILVRLARSECIEHHEMALLANDGRTFYSYMNRHLDVLVDPSGKVVSLGLY